MDPQVLTPIIIGILVVFAIYRRVRRTFGRQPVRTAPLAIRAFLFLLIGVMLGLTISALHPDLLAALGGGMVAGLILGYFGLRHTVFETTEQGRFYTPHTYIGLFVTALFFARVGFRYLAVLTHPQVAGPPAAANPLIAYQRNPLTLALFGLLIGYYVFYNLGVLKRSRETPVVAKQSPAS